MEFLSSNCFGTSNFVFGMWKGNYVLKGQLQEQKFHKNPRGEHKVTTHPQNEYFRENPPIFWEIPLSGWWNFQHRPRMGEIPAVAWVGLGIYVPRQKFHKNPWREGAQSDHGHTTWIFEGKSTYFGENPSQWIGGISSKGPGRVKHLQCPAWDWEFMSQDINSIKTHRVNTKWEFSRKFPSVDAEISSKGPGRLKHLKLPV